MRSTVAIGGARSRRARIASELEGHLTFAFKHEGLDLTVLCRLFDALDPAEIEAIVRAKPTGTYGRRAWFLYEWLTGRKLDLPAMTMGNYVNVVDPKLQYEGSPSASPRHRVKNNLPGTREFCPLVFRTKALDEFLATDLAARAREIVADVPADVLARTAAFLLLKDSRQATPSRANRRRTTAYSGGGAPSARPDASRSISMSCFASSAS
ncbi:hypothetical protein [Hyphomicrobium sp.]|uniref:hypothetical protein n=1 Tax=Hyphomicrobium sp. TaxID=82 RepID=UPI0025BE79BF|nr:hypothetical protein [Hyphomicrobium sp.]